MLEFQDEIMAHIKSSQQGPYQTGLSQALALAYKYFLKENYPDGSTRLRKKREANGA